MQLGGDESEHLHEARSAESTIGSQRRREGSDPVQDGDVFRQYVPAIQLERGHVALGVNSSVIVTRFRRARL